ncbi:MAG: ammonium transporter, Amt family [Dehalococcoidia bacterium]|nr:ammonium transporter, Amt family [Dehalococcoidia bacterium]
MVVTGAGLLWFGWFGFNAGSALTSGGLAASAFVATNTAGATGAFTWTVLSWIHRRPSVLGAATGAVAGLATMTPAAGFVPPVAGIPIGIGAAVLGYYMMLLRSKWNLDESLDVWAVHGMGGTLGTLSVGIFASAAVNAASADGLLYGNAALLGKQFLGVAVAWVFAFGATWVLASIVKAVMGLLVKEEEEEVGLDISQHGERAYGGIAR